MLGKNLPCVEVIFFFYAKFVVEKLLKVMKTVLMTMLMLGLSGNNIIHDIVFKRYLNDFNLSEAYKFFISRVTIF